MDGRDKGKASGSTPSSKDSFSVSAPALSLPKGGGAIRGIGEKFAANPVTGTGAMTVPIAVSPGRSGFGPQLSLSYDSGAGKGVFGLGWNLPLASIARKTDKGLPRYRDTSEPDVFILSGSEDLVPALTNEVRRDGYFVQSYRPRIEGLFARIERWRNAEQPADTYWRSISRDNVTTIYGKTNNSRIYDPTDARRIFSWLICESHDDKGNAIAYEYKVEDAVGVPPAAASDHNRSVGANRHLKRIRYGNRYSRLASPPPADPAWLFEVVFDYGEHSQTDPRPDDAGKWLCRSDSFSSYRAGFEVRTNRLCRRVLMFHHFPDEDIGASCLVKSTDFTYRDLLDPTAAFIASVTQTGYQRKAPGPGYQQKSLPPLEFTYSQTKIDDRLREVDPGSLENLPSGLDGRAYQWVDLDGEGISGILTEQADAWFYKRNLSPVSATSDDGINRTVPIFAPLELVARKPAFAATGTGGWQLLDLAGNGRPDLTRLESPPAGFFQRTDEGSWENFTSFRSVPNLSWSDSNLRFLDLTGDGLADILVTEGQGFTWYPSLGESGFAASERTVHPADDEGGPRLVFSDSEQAIYLADLSGDGLTDLVRIRNGEVCYWPNLGYGRFGAKITMGNAPWFDNPDQFSQRRVRLADIDGSGLVDIIYLGRTGISVYFNQSGNDWSAARTIDQVPQVDDLAAVQVVDLFGNGTACLVWSSALPGNARRPMRYIDLMGGQKPHLLIQTINNLGGRTLVQYSASTKFYLQDKAVGRPWITKLPFPVHVVEKVTVTDDWRKTRFASTSSYHHGYFDGVEREFRGFGRVEQVDVESFGKFGAENADSPYVTTDKTLYQPPVKTVTWFHTGAALDRERILTQFEREYFPRSLADLPTPLSIDQQFTEKPLAEPDVASLGLNASEWREAMRACKGMTLRQEVYELDVDALATDGKQIPVRLFSTATHNCMIRRLQAQASNRHAVFLVTESEALTYHYELDLRPASPPVPLRPDPRIAHSLNLRFDELGNVEQSIAVGYSRVREHQDPSLAVEQLDVIRGVQRERHVAYSETHYTNDAIDVEVAAPHHRLRKPWQVLTYELTGLAPAHGRYFSLSDLREYRLSETLADQGHKAIGKLEYHQRPTVSPSPSISPPERRKVEHVVTLFFAEDLATPLGPGVLNRLGLTYETYKLALTGPLLHAVLGSKFDPATRSKLDSPGTSGYWPGSALLGSAGNNQWWVRSGVAGFDSDAGQRFYLPEFYRDPFGSPSGHLTSVTYDRRYHLFIQSTTDALGNSTSIPTSGSPARLRFDFRVLAPIETVDPNGNRTEVCFDALGMVVAVAVRGKATGADSLAGYSDAMINPDLSTVLHHFDLPALTPEQARARFSPILARATARHLYHFGEELVDGLVAWGRRPAGVCGILREQHSGATPAGSPPSPLQVGFECSDGMGAVLMKRSQAEPAPGATNLRWIVSGKTVLNNKGKPVKQYEPYFSASPACCAEGDAHEEAGVTPLMYYDAPGRLVRTEMPDGTFSRLDFTPWHVSRHDANDTVKDSRWYRERLTKSERAPDSPVLDPDEEVKAKQASAREKRAARLAAQHALTPAVTIFDSLGREVVAVAHNKYVDATSTARDEKYLTFTKLDAEGKPLWVRDARGKIVMRYVCQPPTMPPGALSNTVEPTDFTPAYDLAGNLLFQHSMDAGSRWMLTDAAGKPMRAWDFNQHQSADGSLADEDRVYETRYDPLRRPTEQTLARNGAPPRTVERFEYVDANQLGPFPNLAAARDRNLCGQLYRHYDPSGLAQVDRLDYSGNHLEVRRRLVRDYKETATDWQGDVAAKLETDTFHKVTEYDALKRPTRQYSWHRLTSDRRVAVHEPRYNERGLLAGEQLVVRATRNAATSGKRYDLSSASTRREVIKRITYDAKGSRELLELGNGTVTRYDYDPATFRLRQLRTTRLTSGQGEPAFPSFASNLADPRIVQQLHYTYDPVGNVTEIYDDAYEPVFFKNQQVEPWNRYTYDALYRLVTASGREGFEAPSAPTLPESAARTATFPLTASTLRKYTQHYSYDEAGNIKETRHTALRGDWHRRYEYSPESNRLLRTWEGADLWNDGTATARTEYLHDAHGNMRNLLPVAEAQYLRWDNRDMIGSVDLMGGGRAFYQYDASKQRTRKVIAKENGSGRWERIYLGELELYRRYKGTNPQPVEEIESHHLSDGQQRVLLVDDVIVESPAGSPRPDGLTVRTQTLFRYQYGNRLGSVCLELDAAARIISYEEYHPYGATAYRATTGGTEVPHKRYRYTGMERDEESGLGYHKTRYYLAAIGRWISADSIGIDGGPNLYAYADGRPGAGGDPEGTSVPWITKSMTPQYFTDEASVRTVVDNIHEHYGWSFHPEVSVTLNIGGQPIEGRSDNFAHPPGGSHDLHLQEFKKANPFLKGSGAAFTDPQSLYLVAAGSGEQVTVPFGAGNVSVAPGKSVAVSVNVIFPDNIQEYEALVRAKTPGVDAKAEFVPFRIRSRAAVKATVGGVVAGVLLAPLAANAASGAVPASAQEGTYELVSTLVDAGVEWVQQIGPQNAMAATTAVLAAGRMAATGVLRSSSSTLASVTTAFTAKVAAGRAASIGVTGAAVVAAIGSVALAGAAAVAAFKGERTPIEVADEYYGTHFGNISGWMSGAFSRK